MDWKAFVEIANFVLCVAALVIAIVAYIGVYG